MVKQIMVVWIVTAAAIGIAAALLPSVKVEGGVFALLGVAIVFGLVNALIGPLLRIITLPLTLMTFGLFSLIVNAVLLGITAGLTGDLDLGGIFPAILAALLISVLTSILLFLTTRIFAPRRS